MLKKKPLRKAQQHKHKQKLKESLDVYILVNSLRNDVACALSTGVNHFMHSVGAGYTQS